MKLRILGDSLRLRLSKSDVEAFSTTGRVQDVIRFGGDAQLTYALEHAEDVEALSASFVRDLVLVRMPTSMARGWADTDEITLRSAQSIDADAALSLLIEKDFKCAVPRPGEEDYDGFEHPTGGC
ncbi:MAG: DUF7009 family protein [Nannocystaceae bacterium]|nr:hypothetical protein [bacterium]